MEKVFKKSVMAKKVDNVVTTAPVTREEIRNFWLKAIEEKKIISLKSWNETGTNGNRSHGYEFKTADDNTGITFKFLPKRSSLGLFLVLYQIRTNEEGTLETVDKFFPSELETPLYYALYDAERERLSQKWKKEVRVRKELAEERKQAALANLKKFYDNNRKNFFLKMLSKSCYTISQNSNSLVAPEVALECWNRIMEENRIVFIKNLNRTSDKKDKHNIFRFKVIDNHTESQFEITSNYNGQVFTLYYLENGQKYNDSSASNELKSRVSSKLEDIEFQLDVKEQKAQQAAKEAIEQEKIKTIERVKSFYEKNR